MKSKSEELEKLLIPDEQIGRQAISSLRGYIYQVYQSLAAWISLKEDEILFLETAEDFAVLAKDVLSATQVKDTGKSSSVTLKTKSVSKVIKSLWQFQEANPDKTIYIDYLTTSNIGKEKKLTFPDDHSGLTYWHVAAREGTDVEPIRRALLTLQLTPKISRFIKSATPEQLRKKILCKIRWICGTEDIEPLNKRILDKLICLGEKLHLIPSDSERVRNSLVVEIIKTVIKTSDRELNRADLLRTFEKTSSISVPVSSIRRSMEAMSSVAGDFSGDLVFGSNLIMAVSKIPLAPRVINRNELVSELFSEMGHAGILWLHGSSGVGKTILSQFISRCSEHDWLLVQLRDCSANEINFRLSRTIEALESGRFGGVILDDFPTKYSHNSRLYLLMLMSELRRIDGAIIVTSSKTPSPNLQDCFGNGNPFVFKSPYFCKEEVAELIESAEGDPKKWASIIYTSCGCGHPQLVQARISGLRQRNWPKKELLAGFHPSFGSAKEIDLERESIRERLISELSDRARDLLFRLTLIMGYFDRELAFAVSEANPKIERPGEVLDILLGPWIEIHAIDRFKVSPLVSNAGIKNLVKDMQIDVHKRIVDQLLTRHPFPSDLLGQLLGHAISSRHERGIMWLTIAVMHAPRKHRKMISEQLFMLPLLDSYDQKPLFEENVHVSAMLRMSQFKVAAWSSVIDCLPAIADRLITEARMVDSKDVSKGFLFLAINIVLLEQSLIISPKKWMPLLSELEETLSGKGELVQFLQTLDPVRKGIDGWTLTQFLFAIRSTSLRSIDELTELFSELDDIEPSRRKMLISSLQIVPHGKRLLIESAWLGETRQENMDGISIAEKYHQMSKIAEKWGEKDIAVECEYSRSVMLDEYANDSESALSALDEAEKKYPNSIRLIRQRASVYYRKGDHPTALATIAQIADVIPKENRIDRAFALREAGISAAETSDFERASHFFSEAFEAASNATDNMWPMAVGLKGDCAFAEFKLGHCVKALELAYKSLIAADSLDPDAGPNEKYRLIVLGCLILWMRSEVQGKRDSGDTICFRAGMCSNPQPLDDIMKLKISPRLRLLAWYQLAELEVELQANIGVLEELQKRTTTTKIVSCEQSLIMQLLAGCIQTVDIEQFFLHFPAYIAIRVYCINNADRLLDKDICDMAVSEFPAIKASDWKKDPFLAVAKDAIVALASVAACSGASNFLDSLKNRMEGSEIASTSLRQFIECFKKVPRNSKDLYELTAFCLGRLIEEKTILIPNDIFSITFRLWNWLCQSNFRSAIENVIADYLVKVWRKIITDQRFYLKQPMTSVPPIEATLKEPEKGMAKIAAIILAAENAVKQKLNAKLRAELKEHKLSGDSGVSKGV